MSAAAFLDLCSLIALVILGLASAWLRVRTRSLWPSITLHRLAVWSAKEVGLGHWLRRFFDSAKPSFRSSTMLIPWLTA